MKNSNKRKLRKPVALFIMLFGLALLSWIGWNILSSLIRNFSPESLLYQAMPFLHGITIVQSEDINEHEQAHEDSDMPESEEIRFEVMQADDGVSDEIRIELMGTETQSREDLDLSGENPKILIYHTHTTEAYTPTDEMPYVATDEWRTDDNEKNVVRVGEELAELLRNEYGISVIHDTTNHEPPYLGTAYTRSIQTMEKYLEEYPSIELFIDVHRDAYTLAEGESNSDYAVVNGIRTARLMFVVGTGEGQTGAGFTVKPNYKENYALALAITENLQENSEKLVRPIRVKTGRYNQHIPGRSLLVEVGHNQNTLEEALASVPYLAEAIAKSAKIENTD